MNCILASSSPLTPPLPAPAPEKVCRTCGIAQPLDRFPFRKAEQTYRGTCKTCRAAQSHALRHHPDHAPLIRERERVRSSKRRPAIRQWEREHPDNMRPGQQRRAARRAAKLAAARQAAGQPAPPGAAAQLLQAHDTPGGGVGGQNPSAPPLLDRSSPPQTRACIIQSKKFFLDGR